MRWYSGDNPEIETTGREVRSAEWPLVNLIRSKQRLGLPKGKVRNRTQIGAFYYRDVRGKTRDLLITSRTTRRWTIPKGWPIKRTAPSAAARVEVWEGAGARGKIDPRCTRFHTYLRPCEKTGTAMQFVVNVFPVQVTHLSKEHPERKHRRRKWFFPRNRPPRRSRNRN